MEAPNKAHKLIHGKFIKVAKEARNKKAIEYFFALLLVLTGIYLAFN